ncbi:hypothetical protein HPB48_014302 [Haemaphysalis longicornis]|uniref:Uncharacterized protein n=1 Tax=Haemaphysalis longicornis TaxID=44386 RepID=A0A9J6FLM6_HAELO|nr:hypothetical protein HPB48_014302 [Haemaphysalis longicornis]
MPRLKITKAEALKILKLDGPDPSEADIKQNYQQLALQFHPSKQRGNRLCVKVFDRLCRSYLILTEGKDSMENLLTPPEMLDVFVKAFELEAPPFAWKVPAQDASTQCEGAPSGGAEVTAAPLGASVAKLAAAFAQRAAPTQAPPHVNSACCPKTQEPTGPTKPVVSSKAVASASVATLASGAAPASTTAPEKKPVVAPKKVAEKSAAAFTPDEKQADKDAKKAARKANKGLGMSHDLCGPSFVSCIPGEGCEMCTLGRYKDAIDLFTKAIKKCGDEHSYYGNRSYCYAILEKFDKALKDADTSIQLGPQSAKGFFRRGKALLGLQRYSEAAEAFKMVLKLEPNCPDAEKELHTVHVYELKAEWALGHGATDVQTAVNMLCGPNAVAPDIKENPGNLEGFRSLWVGNITTDVTEKMLQTLFSRYGEVHSIRLLYDRHCAFINYGNTVSPSKAMDALQGTTLCGTTLLIRFPDNNYLEKKKNGYAPKANVT